MKTAEEIIDIIKLRISAAKEGMKRSGRVSGLDSPGFQQYLNAYDELQFLLEDITND